MHDDKRDPSVDELLEASLKQYCGEEPRSGLEMRILAGLRARERAARRRWLVWAVTVCAGAVAIVVMVLHSTRAPVRQPTPSAALPPKESGAQRAPLQPAEPLAPEMVAQGPPGSFGPHRAPLQRRRPVARTEKVATRRSRPEQFPTPLPLTEQEKLLLAYLSKATKPDSVAGTSENEMDEAPLSDLEIPGIKIAALEIKPLDDSQSEQQK
jgi:hypothetical protein